ncbi:uncharacterized protein LOC143461688 isoform X2 [Clavelina lepadiformis]
MLVLNFFYFSLHRKDKVQLPDGAMLPNKYAFFASHAICKKYVFSNDTTSCDREILDRYCPQESVSTTSLPAQLTASIKTRTNKRFWRLRFSYVLVPCQTESAKDERQMEVVSTSSGSLIAGVVVLCIMLAISFVVIAILAKKFIWRSGDKLMVENLTENTTYENNGYDVPATIIPSNAYESVASIRSQRFDTDNRHQINESAGVNTDPQTIGQEREMVVNVIYQPLDRNGNFERHNDRVV